MKKFSWLVFAFVLFLLVGCSNSEQANSADSSNTEEETNTEETAASDSNETQYPLTIDNYLTTDGVTYETHSQTFEEAPSKVVANTQGMAEILVHLGLTDKIVGVSALYGETDPEIAEDFAKIPVISEGYAGKELVVGADPDLVMGRAGLFQDAEWGVGSITGLNELGINTFVQHASLTGGTLDSLYKDIEDIGQIFNVQDAAADYINELKEKQSAIEEKASEKPLTYAYVFDGGEGKISPDPGGDYTFIADILDNLNLTNALADSEGTVSVEQLVEINPDMLILSHYAGGPDTQATIDSFYNDEALQSINAIKNKAIMVIDFNQFFGYGPTILDGASKLADDVAANENLK
ncbi:ABC transporter substrate-binding protein [Bacillus mesophilum]|uniref:ABC transporter substrate-binding protein n=1 Tax=Bacillus mesophilum TaxID=1071718 RepID=A0A7V7RIQ6_9BACI|nr:ABC transporter substrate-binding protein [Bacillus mesophilum]KAB2330316.1 ABC transporter substrate-binding protein [Bacillus mesophilum]